MLSPRYLMRFGARAAQKFRAIDRLSYGPQSLFRGKQGQSLGYVRYFSSTFDVVLPTLADSIDSGTLATWEKKVGDYCKVDDVIAIIDTDKVSVDVKATQAGELVETLAKEGDELKVGDVIAKMAPKDSPNEEDPRAKSAQTTGEIQEKKSKAPKQPEPKTEAPINSTPTKQASKNTSSSPVTSVKTPGSRSEHRVKMTPIRKKTAERLKQAQNTAASLTTFNEIDMSNLINMRNTFKDAFLEKHDVKLGFMSAFVAASVAALKEIPVVNGRIEDEFIVYQDFIDVSIAVSSPRGLVVPVLRNCENKSFLEIEQEIVNLGNKARENKLSLEDMSGGTFTVTNGGVFGSMMSTPMINSPQSAILGMHGVKERAVVINGKIEIRPMMYVALTYDHRIIDGRESVTFLKSIKEKVEDPVRLLLDL